MKVQEIIQKGFLQHSPYTSILSSCLLLCPGPGRGVGVCNEQGDRQQHAAVQMFLRNHGLQGQH